VRRNSQSASVSSSFVHKAMSTPAWCTRCRQWNRSKAPNKPGDEPTSPVYTMPTMEPIESTEQSAEQTSFHQGNDENDRTLVEEDARNKAQITVVTFLHKRIVQTNALARTWYIPGDMSALEHMAQGRVLWLEARTHDNVSITIVNVHQVTAKRHQLHCQVTLLVRTMIDAALTQRRIMGGDFNMALSRYGYAQSTSALYDKMDKFFQDFVHSMHGTLIESEAHMRRDLLRGSSASLDHIIKWNLTCTNT